MNAGRIHHFIVPREEFNGTSYRFTIQEQRSSLWRNIINGKTIESAVFQFKGDYKDDLNLLIASDWHNYPEHMLVASSHFLEPDLFLMLGDFATVCQTEDDFILNTLAAGADATKSEIPAIYVRGNHDLEGEMADLGCQNLGLERFYYQVQRGKYLFTVCDSADVWDSILDFDDYRDAQLDWLEALPLQEDGTIHFAAVHIPNFDENNEHTDKQARYYAALERLGVGMQFSGHWHELLLEQPGSGYLEAPFPVLIDGGPIGRSRGNYVCSMAQVAADGTVRLISYDRDGVNLMDETLHIE